jgi:hypothetical protein
VIAFLQKHMTSEVVNWNYEADRRLYLPAGCSAEAIMNAIVHADYTQRGAPFASPSSMIDSHGCGRDAARFLTSASKLEENQISGVRRNKAIIYNLLFAQTTAHAPKRRG